MNAVTFLKDRIPFLTFYITIMSFVSLIMFLSVEHHNAANNILYTNITCLFITLIYLAAGYYRKWDFYRGINQAARNDEHHEITPLLPEPKNGEQNLYMELLKKLDREKIKQLENLQSEKKDQQEFILSWIHEIKLPIAASHMLIENHDDTSVEILADKLENELSKIEEYVDQALYYSKIDSFSKDYFITEVNINKIVKNSVKKYSKHFINKRISLGVWDEKQTVQSDSKWLGFIIDQVMANALKYTEEGGKINILFEENDVEKRLILEDDGVGISPEDIPRVFEKGFTGAVGRTHNKATGMGLYLSRQLAGKLGHEMSISSKEGKYTKVNIHFPKIRNYYRL
ncbi:sensor histidine kinase [Thalassobacillus pellis]|uniref:sensor histidine kinase n=1 Tax=Thalassobacillus pellis TaxID=748008 RepID=UPI0019605813|nr:sensor histidine kinase [Thalassobacillus pellis]MBM7553438.1 signal transduction histidine kinase [Thalassobacillus pellis]